MLVLRRTGEAGTRCRDVGADTDAGWNVAVNGRTGLGYLLLGNREEGATNAVVGLAGFGSAEGACEERGQGRTADARPLIGLSVQNTPYVCVDITPLYLPYHASCIASALPLSG